MKTNGYGVCVKCVKNYMGKKKSGAATPPPPFFELVMAGFSGVAQNGKYSPSLFTVQAGPSWATFECDILLSLCNKSKNGDRSVLNCFTKAIHSAKQP